MSKKEILKVDPRIIQIGASTFSLSTFPRRLSRIEVLTVTPGYEEEAPPENYYAHDPHDDEYSPSTPHASGGSYYANPADFPPPPTGEAAPTAGSYAPPAGGYAPPTGGYTPHPTQPSAHPPPETTIPPYNPQDYAAHDPYAYPAPRTGDNVSSVPPVPPAASANVPYFPPPPTAPIVPNEHLRDGGARSFLFL